MFTLRKQARQFRNWLVLLCTGSETYESLGEEHYRQRILVMTAAFWLLIIALLTVITPLLLDLKQDAVIAADLMYATTSAGAILSLLLLRLFGSRTIALNIMLVIYTVAFAGSCLFLGGTASPTFHLLIMVPVLAGLVGSVSLSIGWGLLVLAFWVSLLMFERIGFQFPQVIAPENRSMGMLMAHCALGGGGGGGGGFCDCQHHHYLCRNEQGPARGFTGIQ